jgi:hypothetical protein
MSYTLSFGDPDAETAFFDRLYDYVVQITQPNLKPATYRISGSLGWDDERQCPTLPVTLWDEVHDQASVDTATLYLTGDEEIHIF